MVKNEITDAVFASDNQTELINYQKNIVFGHIIYHSASVILRLYIQESGLLLSQFSSLWRNKN